MFVAKYWNEINATGVKFCITPSLSVYESLEDKWYVKNNNVNVKC